MRERWWGASGRRVPELAVEGDPAVPAEEALVIDGVDDLQPIAEAFDRQGITIPAPGTAVASLAMWRETGDAIWAERFRRDICRLWSELRPCFSSLPPEGIGCY